VFDAVTQKLTIDLLINNAGFVSMVLCRTGWGAAGQNGSVEYFGLSRFDTSILPECGSAVLEASLICPDCGVSTDALLFRAASKAFVLSFSEALSAENRDYGDVPSRLPWTNGDKLFQEAEFPHC